MGLDETCIGTTRTRAWAAVGDRVVASAEVAAGARDGARDGRPDGLAVAVRRLLLEVERRCRATDGRPPVLAVAAGMITSPQGLVDVPHVEPPADTRDLARAASCRVRGGDFSAVASASRTMDAVGFYEWGSTAQMVSDVQGWVDSPGENFGWVLLGTRPRPPRRRDGT